MTFRMLDSIFPANLPPGADAYLAYADGRWATAVEVKARFPGARVLVLAVFPADAAEGLDIENGDATIPEVYGWFVRQQRRGVWRPVLYISAGRAQGLLDTMAANGFPRSSFRLLSAHYKAGKHICGPSTCGYPQADGTQWRDDAPGVGGSRIDESLLVDSFFPAPPAPPHVHQEGDMQMLTTGTKAQTVIMLTAGGPQGIHFGNDCTLLGLPAPVVRVAMHSVSRGWQVVTLTLTASGTSEVPFPVPDTDMVSVSRVSAGPGDGVAVGWVLA